MDAWPKALVPAEGPMRADKVAGAAEGMGSWGTECQGLFDEGYLQPDLLTGLTLFILGNQPRDPAQKQKIPGAGGGVAGGVWYVNVSRYTGRYGGTKCSPSPDNLWGDMCTKVDATVLIPV